MSYFKCGLACTDTVSAGAHLFLGDMMSLALLSQVMLLCVALVCVAVSLHKDACCLHGACLRAAAARC